MTWPAPTVGPQRLPWPPSGDATPRGAHLVGFSAYAVDRLLRALLTDPATWRAVTDPLSPRQRQALTRALRAIYEAADEWLTLEESAAGGNAATPVGQAEAASIRDDEIDTAEAAELLGLRERRVRDLAAAGVLGARRVGGSWRYSRAAVLAFAAERRRAG